jgi:predicted RecA/RadA family phage recombinase
MSAERYSADGSIDYTPDTDVSAGDVVQIGSITAVALRDIADGELGALATEGVFKIDLASGKTFDQGDAVYVDSSSDATTDDSEIPFGYAIADSGSGVVYARLGDTLPTQSDGS